QTQREQREKAAILEGVAHGLFLLDPEGRIVLLNQSAAHFFQKVSDRGPGQLIGQSIWQQCPEVADSTFARECYQAEAEHRAFQVETYLPGLGRWFAFHGTCSPEGLCVLVHDVTERTQLERSLRSRAEELAESNRGKEEFLVQLAHELRNCLAPIRTALHLWGAEGAGIAEEEQARVMAEGEVRHISRLL